MSSDLLTALGSSQRRAAKAIGMSSSALSRALASGHWPKRGGLIAKQKFEQFLSDLQSELHKEVGPDVVEHVEAAPRETQSTVNSTESTQEEMQMLLKNETLTPLARKHFGISRSPFVNDINSREDVYTSQHGRYVRAAMLEAATNHGFVAIIGQSGSGKSTLREELAERIREEARPIVMITPYVAGMEPNEKRGKPLRSGQIAETIMDVLAPGVSLKNSPHARYKQLHELLKSSRSAGHTHLLVIEEAHRLPIPTLKHLKNFMEMKDGLRRLLGVCLIGQNELADLLSEKNPEVREIVQRCEQITMEPLDNDVEAYLQLKFDRINTKMADLFEADAMDAIRARLIQNVQGRRTNDVVSICYPLVVNNLVCRALNAAAAVGYPKVDAQVIAGC